ncbi:hypothetical protein AHF37_02025 [Paragonimus kellicotti]|nr:hypothetical protein AHF37_02025 [Paragonimus kellicotti]
MFPDIVYVHTGVVCQLFSPLHFLLQTCFKLSVGRLFHSISLEEDSITLTSYRPRIEDDPISLEYKYSLRVPDALSYHLRQTVFSNNAITVLNWSYLDNYVCARGVSDSYVLNPSLKFWRSRFMLVPIYTNETKTHYRCHQRSDLAVKFTSDVFIDARSLNNNGSRVLCDVYESDYGSLDRKKFCEKFLSFLEIVNRVRRVPTSSSKMSRQPHASSPLKSPIASVGACSRMGKLLELGPAPYSGTVCKFSFEPSVLMQYGYKWPIVGTLGNDPVSFQTDTSLNTSCHLDPASKFEVVPNVKHTKPLRQFRRHTSVLPDAAWHEVDSPTKLTCLNANTAATPISTTKISTIRVTSDIGTPSQWARERSASILYLSQIAKSNVSVKLVGPLTKPVDASINVKPVSFPEAFIPKATPGPSGWTVDFQTEWAEVAFAYSAYEPCYSTTSFKPMEANSCGKSSTQQKLGVNPRNGFLTYENISTICGVPGKVGYHNSDSTLQKSCVCDLDDPATEGRVEWAHCVYDANYHPRCAFSLELQWLVASGTKLSELISNWHCRACKFEFHLFPVPCFPFGHATMRSDTDPLRAPIFVSINVRSLLPCVSNMPVSDTGTWMDRGSTSFGLPGVQIATHCDSDRNPLDVAARLFPGMCNWHCRACKFEFHLFPVPCFPFGHATMRSDTDPLRAPIFVSINVRSLLPCVSNMPVSDTGTWMDRGSTSFGLPGVQIATHCDSDRNPLDVAARLFPGYTSVQQLHLLRLFQEHLVVKFGFICDRHDEQRTVSAGLSFESILNAPDSPKPWIHVHCSGGMFIMVPVYRNDAVTPTSPAMLSTALSSSGQTLQDTVSTSFRASQSPLEMDCASDAATPYPLRYTISTKETANEDTEYKNSCFASQVDIGYFWSWNHMLPKRWRGYLTGDESFQDAVLADFRAFMNAEDGRLMCAFQSFVYNLSPIGKGEGTASRSPPSVQVFPNKSDRHNSGQN